MGASSRGTDLDLWRIEKTMATQRHARAFYNAAARQNGGEAKAFQRGVDFVVLNDEPGEMDSAVVAGFLSVVTLSEAFGISASEIGGLVVSLRERHSAGLLAEKDLR